MPLAFLDSPGLTEGCSGSKRDGEKPKWNGTSPQFRNREVGVAWAWITGLKLENCANIENYEMRSSRPLSNPEWLSSLPSIQFKFIVFNTKPQHRAGCLPTRSYHGDWRWSSKGVMWQRECGCQLLRSSGAWGNHSKIELHRGALCHPPP